MYATEKEKGGNFGGGDEGESWSSSPASLGLGAWKFGLGPAFFMAALSLAKEERRERMCGLGVVLSRPVGFCCRKRVVERDSG